MLPEAKPSSYHYGDTHAGYFGGEISITGIAGTNKPPYLTQPASTQEMQRILTEQVLSY